MKHVLGALGARSGLSKTTETVICHKSHRHSRQKSEEILERHKAHNLSIKTQIFL